MRKVISLLISMSVINWAMGQDDTATRKAPPVVAAVNDAMQKFVDDGQIAGAVTLVGQNGRIVHLGAVGLADIEAARPMQPNTLFAVASMTKPIVATGIMLLQDEKKLSIDDKVSKYVPAFANAKLKSGARPQREITIRDLLTHTSGLGGSQVFTGTLAEVADELAQRPLDFEPGSRWQYGPGLTVAGHVIEVVSQQSLQDFLQQRIFAPLQMNNTTFFVRPEQANRLAKIYALSDDGKSLTPAENFIGDPTKATAPNPSGGLVSTARDMFKFYRFVLNHGAWRGQTIMSRAAVDTMTTVQTGDLEAGFLPGHSWGLGWCIVRKPQGLTDRLSAGTYGHGGAFGTQGWVDPVTDTIYVLLLQRSNLANSDGSDIRKAFHEAAADAVNRGQRVSK